MRLARQLRCLLIAGCAVAAVLPADALAQNRVAPFPSATSTYVHNGVGFINATDVGYFWSRTRGDKVAQTFPGGPPLVNRIELDLDVRSNSLTVAMDWDVKVKGTVVGRFTVPPGVTGPLSADLNFDPIGPGPYAVEIAAATEVCGGCGSITLGYADPAVHRVLLRDGAPPETTLSETPAAVVESSSATVKFASPDADVVRFECSLDDAAFSPCTSPQAYGDLGAGPHTVRVRAVDGSGNADPTPASATWRADPVGPACADGAVTVASGTATIIKLPCSDPDGDPFTTAIVTPPTIGTLGAVDQATQTVAYAASLGTFGSTAFTYRAGYGGFTSNTGTFTVNVTPPPCLPKPEVPLNGTDEDCDGKDGSLVTSSISNRWTAYPKYTRVLRLAVVNLPAGATVLVVCKGKGCPYKRRSLTTRVARAKVNLIKPFRKRKLRPGGTVEIRITLAGSIGKVVRYDVRRKATPKSTILCLAPGAAKPSKCA